MAKATVRVLAVVPGGEVVGEMHLPEGTKDAVVGFLKLRDLFIHFGDASVTFGQGLTEPTLLNTVILNRLSIQLLCMAD
ncbi:MAG: hypothetical protein LC797_15155 [Chloroflexi bacterium]|nr:hypothetical protein [Chloroflexota bacterium]